jgi:hypothetical protein
LIIILGQRIDFVLNVDQEPRDYWIKVRGEGLCTFNRVYQRALLKYERDDYSFGKLDSSVDFSFEDTVRKGRVKE